MFWDQGNQSGGLTSLRDDEEIGGGRAICCAACGHRVTTAAERVDVDGTHEHHCVNPHGHAFHFGCFAHAPGCTPLGEQNTYWSWFPGYRWQLEHCGGCGDHLGWLFTTNQHRFHGLILDRLVERKE